MKLTIERKNQKPTPVAAYDPETDDSHWRLHLPLSSSSHVEIFGAGGAIQTGGTLEDVIERGAEPIFPGDKMTIEF